MDTSTIDAYDRSPVGVQVIPQFQRTAFKLSPSLAFK
jgi:hypothetical protein